MRGSPVVQSSTGNTIDRGYGRKSTRRIGYISMFDIVLVMLMLMLMLTNFPAGFIVSTITGNDRFERIIWAPGQGGRYDATSGGESRDSVIVQMNPMLKCRSMRRGCQMLADCPHFEASLVNRLLLDAHCRIPQWPQVIDHPRST